MGAVGWHDIPDGVTSRISHLLLELLSMKEGLARSLVGSETIEVPGWFPSVALC